MNDQTHMEEMLVNHYLHEVARYTTKVRIATITNMVKDNKDHLFNKIRNEVVKLST